MALWRPGKSMEYFENGYIMCSCCGFKPDDPWSTEPEGFTYSEYEHAWLCDECLGADDIDNNFLEYVYKKIREPS